jgi:hypothetical protein
MIILVIHLTYVGRRFRSHFCLELKAKAAFKSQPHKARSVKKDGLLPPMRFPTFGCVCILFSTLERGHRTDKNAVIFNIDCILTNENAVILNVDCILTNKNAVIFNVNCILTKTFSEVGLFMSNVSGSLFAQALVLKLIYEQPSVQVSSQILFHE